MARATRTTIACPNCRHPINAVLENLIDVGQDPEAKVRLLTGRTNTVQCPNCGVTSTVAAPMLYHDPDKQLLISYLPMELTMPKDQQERVMGDLMRELTRSLPQEQVKGYLFQPKQALTMQGLVDQILQADGVTPEMMEAQRATVRLVETFLQATDDMLPALVQQNDAQIDAQFFQATSVMAQRALQENRPDLAQRIMEVQSQVAEFSTFGQELIAQNEMQEELVESVADDLNALGAGAQRADIIDLAVKYVGDDARLQALVGLARPAMDSMFFQELSMRIGQSPAAERDQLETLRTDLTELVAIIDQQSQLALQDAVRLLQAIANSPDPVALISENLALIDDTFMTVLTANIQESERRGDVNSSARLKQIYQVVVSVLQANMQPELRFVNQLLSTQTDEEARQLITAEAGQFGEGLIDVIDAVGQVLAQRGENEMIQKLAFLRAATAQHFQR
jgi:hypothetical protein